MKLLLIFAASLLSLTYATTPDNVSSRLMVHIPQKLSKDKGYDHREALFGIPPYGGSISTNLFYADSDLCDQNVNTHGGYPARKEKNGQMESWPSPFILMVDRGGCTFVKKVRNAQRAGAAGVVIADNVCLCTDGECIRRANGTMCETSEPIMADDGSGKDISIPSFLMFKVDADTLKAEVKNNNPVQLEMAWALPTPDDRVEYDLWTVPTDILSRPFLEGFKDVASSLGKSAYFTPHFYIYDGVRSNCEGANGNNQCASLCTNHGRYCATDPDNDFDSGISGADVVKESLRRICIWKHYGDENGIGGNWWDYVSQFNRLCNTGDFFMNDDCIRDAYKHSKVDGDAINRCMRDSGGLDQDGPNTFLDQEIKNSNEQGVVILPTVFVNNAALRGRLNVANVFDAICAGFADGTKPKICSQCDKCGDPAECVKAKGVCKHSVGRNTGGVSNFTFGISMMSVIALFIGLGIWQYRKSREDMRDQVRGILAEYMPLEDQEMNGSSPMDFAQKAGKTSLIST